MSAGTIEQVAPPAEPAGIVLHGVSWEFYERFLDEIEEKSRVRLNYDDGELEIMPALQFVHENSKHLIARMITTLTEEFDLPLCGAGSLTLRRELKRKGLEPDECYYIENEAAVRGKRRLHLEHDPPPDLALEVDDTSSSLDRMSIYAAIGVPEVWRFRIDGLTLHVLSGQQFLQVTESPHFLGIHVDELNRFLRSVTTEEGNAWIRGFRQWVREQISGQQT